MEKLLLMPEQGDYSLAPGTAYGRVQNNGPAGRYAPTVPNPTSRVNATWLLNHAELREFGQFYLEHGEQQRPFLIDLITRDGKALRECVAYFDTDAFMFDSTSGESYRISCTLQVAEL